MRYFLDTEYNGFGGALLSLALVPERGDDEFYVTLQCPDPLADWVVQHVVPFLDHVPSCLVAPRLTREDAAAALSNYLSGDSDPEIVADWPEDFALLCMLMLTGPGRMVPVPGLTLRLLTLTNFSTAGVSAVPHNALHDARALRHHVISHLESSANSA